jgi:hypothetical protein
MYDAFHNTRDENEKNRANDGMLIGTWYLFIYELEADPRHLPAA